MFMMVTDVCMSVNDCNWHVNFGKNKTRQVHNLFQNRDLTTVYTNDNWFVILLSHVYFGN